MTLLVFGTETICHCDIVVGVGTTCRIVLPRMFLIDKSTFLYIGIASIACAHTIVGDATAIQAVDDMYLSETDAWHTLTAAFIPPAVGIGDVEASFVFSGILVTAADQVGIAMVVGTASPSAPWVDKIAEAAPGDTDIIAAVLTVQITVNAILKVTMVDPDTLASLKGEIVVAVNIISTCSFERKIPEDDILAVLENEYATFVSVVRVSGIA